MLCALGDAQCKIGKLTENTLIMTQSLLLVCTWRHGRLVAGVLGLRTNAFPSSENKTRFSCKFFEKSSIVSTTNTIPTWPPWQMVPRQEYSQVNKNITHIGTAHSSGFCPKIDFKINHISFISSKILSARSNVCTSKPNVFGTYSGCLHKYDTGKTEWVSFQGEVYMYCIHKHNKIAPPVSPSAHAAKARLTDWSVLHVKE